MENSNVVFKKATLELAKQFYGEDSKMKSFKGYVAMISDRVIGVAGLYYEDGNIVLFSDMKDEFRPHKKAIVKAIQKIRDFIQDTKHPILAFAQEGELLSKKILLKLGFVFAGESQAGSVFIRRP